MVSNVEVTRVLGKNGSTTLEYAIWTYSVMYPLIKYREKRHLIQITFYLKPVRLKGKKVQKTWYIQSCLGDCLSKQSNAKRRFLCKKMKDLPT